MQFQHNFLMCLAFLLGLVEIHTWFIIHAVHTNEPCAKSCDPNTDIETYRKLKQQHAVLKEK